jgi:hypothetical protein
VDLQSLGTVHFPGLQHILRASPEPPAPRQWEWITKLSIPRQGVHRISKRWIEFLKARAILIP